MLFGLMHVVFLLCYVVKLTRQVSAHSCCRFEAVLQVSTQPAITCSKLIIEKLKQGVNFEHISPFVLVFLKLTLSR